MPGVAPAVEGLVNVRGGLVTVVDGHVLLGQPRPAEAEQARRCCVDRGGKVAGLTVGEVLDFLEVPERRGGVRAERCPGVDPSVVRAVGECGGRRFVLLDLDALLAPLLGG